MGVTRRTSLLATQRAAAARCLRVAKTSLRLSAALPLVFSVGLMELSPVSICESVAFSNWARKASRCLRHSVSLAWLEKTSQWGSEALVSTTVLPAGLTENGGMSKSHAIRLAALRWPHGCLVLIKTV